MMHHDDVRVCIQAVRAVENCCWRWHQRQQPLVTVVTMGHGFGIHASHECRVDAPKIATVYTVHV